METNTTQTQTKQYDPNEPSLKDRKGGALWIKEGKNGKYLSLQIEINGEKFNLTGLKNNFHAENPEINPNYTLHWSVQAYEKIKAGSTQVVKIKSVKTEIKKSAPQEEVDL